MIGQETKLVPSYSIEEVYALYREDIANVVAYIEVYEHDLPPKYTSQIAELFINLSLFQNSTESFPGSALFCSSETVAQAIRFHAIFVLLKKIREKEAMFKKYHYKGSVIPETDFHVYSEICRMKNDAVSALLRKLRIYYRCSIRGFLADFLNPDEAYDFRSLLQYLACFLSVHIQHSAKWEDEPFIPPKYLVHVVNGEYMDLAEEYKKVRDLLIFCEDHTSDVIRSGSRITFTHAVFIAVTSWIVPIILGIPVLRFLYHWALHFLEAGMHFFRK